MIVYNKQHGYDELQREDRFHIDGHCRKGERIVVYMESEDGRAQVLFETSYPHEWRFHCLITAGVLEKRVLFEP